jgi:hypothetical protein
LARLAINFKNAGNGGFFNVFEVPQMEKWMENGRWKTAWATRQVWRSSGILFSQRTPS